MNNKTQLLAELQSALALLLEALRTREIYQEEERPLSMTKKASGGFVNRICRQAEVIIHLEAPQRQRIPWIEQPSWKQSFDHPANQYVCWILQRVNIQLPPTSPLAKITPAPLCNASLQVILNDPLYAEVHRIGSILITL